MIAADLLEPHWPAAARVAVREQVVAKAQEEADRTIGGRTDVDALGFRAFIVSERLEEYDAAVARLADIVALPGAAGRERLAFLLAHRTKLTVPSAAAFLAGVERGICSLMPFDADRAARISAMRRRQAGLEPA